MRVAKYLRILIFISCLIILAQKGWAEKADADMFASVVVNPIFSLSLDNANINFGYVDPGTSVELKETTYYNMVVCNSNKGSTWYMKVSILGEVVGASEIAMDSFKFKIFSSTGDGTYKNDWQPFTKEAQVAYTSGTNDSAGGDVEIRFKYRLDLPGNAAGGNYSVKVLYTMTDVP